MKKGAIDKVNREGNCGEQIYSTIITKKINKHETILENPSF